jgi:hypothetical protein
MLAMRSNLLFLPFPKPYTLAPLPRDPDADAGAFSQSHFFVCKKEVKSKD